MRASRIVLLAGLLLLGGCTTPIGPQRWVGLHPLDTHLQERLWKQLTVGEALLLLGDPDAALKAGQGVRYSVRWFPRFDRDGLKEDADRLVRRSLQPLRPYLLPLVE